MRTFKRPLGLKLVIGYKSLKSPVFLALAAWLAWSPSGAEHVAEALARELTDAGAFWAQLAAWIRAHVTPKTIAIGAIIAVVDGVVTAVEAALLWSGRVWGEWLVVAGVGSLLPFELVSIVRHPSWLKAGTVLVNAVMVGYLVWRRVEHAEAAHDAENARPSDESRDGAKLNPP